jgi:hypothetical protein
MSPVLEIRGAISKLRIRLIFQIMHNYFLAFKELVSKQPKSLGIPLIDYIYSPNKRYVGDLVQEMIKNHTQVSTLLLNLSRCNVDLHL